MRRPGSRKRSGLIVCSIIVAILAAVLRLSWPRDRLLTDMARLVLRVDTSRDVRGEPKETVYWLDANRLVILSGDYDDPHRPDNWRGRAALFDISTHARTGLVGLTQFLNRPGLSVERVPTDFELSPNGTWLRFQNHVNGSNMPGVTAWK